MLYRFFDTIPANIAKADMREKQIKVAAGIIVKVDLKFPSGCKELAHASIWRGTHQVFPTNLEDDFHADGETITFAEYYHVKRSQYWTLRTWNEDDTYKHTVTLRLNILAEEFAAPYSILKDFVGSFKRMLRI